MAVISYKCPNCDGELMFDPATQKYRCPYCISLFTQEEIDAMYPDTAGEQQGKTSIQKKTAEQKQSSGEKEGDAVSYSCPSCGAQIVTEETTAATFCYYCHNPVILGERLEKKYLPDKVIPFEITKEDAVKGFLKYVGKKKFVPKAFWDKKQIDSITGVYFPYWMYDVEFKASVQGEGKKIRSWRTGNVQYTETKEYAIEREGNVTMQNLTENALKKANAVLAKGVMPYAFEKAKTFHMACLSGFMAERRDIERKEVEPQMQQTMRQSAEKLFRETITEYDSVHIGNNNFSPKKEKWNYILCPVWTITYKGKDGKIYYYSMNGQTGKVIGELPLDYKKVTLVSALVAGIVLILGLLGGYLA